MAAGSTLRYGENNESNEENNTESKDDDSDNEEQGQPGLRKSQRVITRPKYLNNYVLLAEEEGERLLMCRMMSLEI